jgi:hypothetical protein
MWFDLGLGVVLMPYTISGRSIVVTAKQQVACDLAGEAVILNIKDGVYYGLNSTGAQVWNLLQKPQIVSDILSALLQQYDVEPERCEQDLLALLHELAARDLIEISNEAPA